MPLLRFVNIQSRKGKHTVKRMCEVLNVSESGHYRWLKNRDKATRRQLLSARIKNKVDEHPDNSNYGVNRIQAALRLTGIEVSRRTIYRAMKEAGLLHHRCRPHGITKAITEIQDRENIIKRDFSADAPMKKFLTDITEVQCFDGKLYVSPIMDCFNGEIVALEMRDNMKKELCIDTVKQLKVNCRNLNGAILHSDRGSQYTSEAFREELKKSGIIQSLSGTGHCFDNARMESFFATLKKEKIYRIRNKRKIPSTAGSFSSHSTRYFLLFTPIPIATVLIFLCYCFMNTVLNCGPHFLLVCF